MIAPTAYLRARGTGTVPSWRVNLSGDSRNLKTLAGLDVGVSEEGSAFVLRRPELDTLTDVQMVRSQAVELVDALNGLGWVADPDFVPVGVGSVIGDDGSQTITVSAGELLMLGEHLKAEIIDAATGQPIPPPPPPLIYAKALGIAPKDEAVRRALHFLVPPVTALNLWKVFEVIRDQFDEDEMIRRQWTTKTEIRRFRHSLNSPDALGDEARHGVEISQPPSDPMSLPECQVFVRRLVTKWLESK